MLDRFERAFIRFNRWLLIVLLAAMAVVVFAAVLMRYFTTESLVWGEEVARHLMIWLTFLGSGLTLRHGGHIAIDNLQNALSPRWARALRLTIVLALLAFFATMVWVGVSYVERTRFQLTPALQLPFGYVYAAMPIGFLFMLIHLLLVARDFVRLRKFAAGGDLDASIEGAL